MYLLQCSCGRPTPLSRAYFCDSHFALRCALCTSTLLDASGSACLRCARVLPAADVAAAGGVCDACCDCPRCGGAAAIARQPPAGGIASYRFACGACGWDSGALCAAAPSALRDALSEARAGEATGGVVPALVELLQQSVLGARWAGVGHVGVGAAGRPRAPAELPRDGSSEGVAGVESRREAVDALFARGMQPALLAQRSDARLGDGAGGVDAALAAASVKAAHASLQASAWRAGGALAPLLPLPAPLTPLLTRRCTSCRAAGEPGLLALAGGPASGADISAAAVGSALWYRKLCNAATLLPAVQPGAAGGASAREAAGRACPAGFTQRVLAISNPCEQGVAVLLLAPPHARFFCAETGAPLPVMEAGEVALPTAAQPLCLTLQRLLLRAEEAASLGTQEAAAGLPRGGRALLLALGGCPSSDGGAAESGSGGAPEEGPAPGDSPLLRQAQPLASQAGSATLQLLLALPPDTPCRLGLAVLLPAAAVARRTGALELQEAARKAQCAVCTLVVEAASG